eukprot:CAMPEP_0113462542 /NCGR_PEP_ID=MMETSP0014_2-20120614/12154_1 /TAXON_ID=2857 /ORGANISM="Nitzschia sp." /LENGTH=154 /DNA_ID=CAMNT_0000354425 /DNA_START=61 /DNA_END=525 /DNA_ORIENTATION=+ /assembly_acc=CAM_ASM_000159
MMMSSKRFSPSSFLLSMMVVIVGLMISSLSPSTAAMGFTASSPSNTFVVTRGKATKATTAAPSFSSRTTSNLSAGPMVDDILMSSPLSQSEVLSSSSSLLQAAGTLDPTTVLSDVFGVLLGTPAILAVPILAALGVAGLIAWFIVSYANPEVEE